MDECHIIEVVESEEAGRHSAGDAEIAEVNPTISDAWN